jgi:hypothetical protein
MSNVLTYLLVGETIDRCVPPPPFSFDNELTPDTIAPNTSITVWVSGGVSPFTWSNPGHGYSWASPTTTGNSNELTCASGTCGSAYDCNAKFTIEDRCESTTNNIVIRNTCGGWVQVDRESAVARGITGTCGLGGSVNCFDGSDVELVSGSERWLLREQAYFNQANCNCIWAQPEWSSPNNHPPPCGNGKQCWDMYREELSSPLCCDGDTRQAMVFIMRYIYYEWRCSP